MDIPILLGTLQKFFCWCTLILVSVQFFYLNNIINIKVNNRRIMMYRDSSLLVIIPPPYLIRSAPNN